jgi:hypothetical protein
MSDHNLKVHHCYIINILITTHLAVQPYNKCTQHTPTRIANLYMVECKSKCAGAVNVSHSDPHLSTLLSDVHEWMHNIQHVSQEQVILCSYIVSLLAIPSTVITVCIHRCESPLRGKHSCLCEVAAHRFICLQMGASFLSRLSLFVQACCGGLLLPTL